MYDIEKLVDALLESYERQRIDMYAVRGMFRIGEGQDAYWMCKRWDSVARAFEVTVKVYVRGEWYEAQGYAYNSAITRIAPMLANMIRQAIAQESEDELFEIAMAV